MSLYRRWRPRTFAALVGQAAVVTTLTTALETGRLAHAYLFSGPRGSGKTSAAKILARCINCVKGPTATPDNTCENCTAILDGTALDVLELDAASNGGVDAIRTLRDTVRYAPSAMRKKVYILDEAHMLTKEGANAFLKTLEEPPEWAVFVLATTDPTALPATVLSRCQRYAFHRIAIVTMIARMREIADAEEIAIDDQALGAIAYRADGGLRDALTMLEQVSSFASGPVDASTVDAAFGIASGAFARTLRDLTLDGDAAQVLRIIDESSDAGADMAGLIRATIAEFRHLLVARVNPELLSRDLSDDDARMARERSAATPQAHVVRALRLLSDALAAARSSTNPRLEMETALLRFILQGEDSTLAALAARVTALESGAGPPALAVLAAPAPTPPTEDVRAAPGPAGAPQAATDLTLTRIRSLWQSIRTHAEGEKSSLRAGLSRATVASLEGDKLTLVAPDPPSAAVLRRDATTIQSAITKITGRTVTVHVQQRGDTTSRADPSARRPPGDDPADAGDDLLAYALENL